MARAKDLTPPIDTTVEEEVVTFDFGLLLDTGEIISSIISVTCEVYIGIDADADDRQVGTAAIEPSPATGLTSGAVAQLFGTMIAGVTYRLSCNVLTSTGQKLNIWVHLPCIEPD